MAPPCQLSNTAECPTPVVSNSADGLVFQYSGNGLISGFDWHRGPDGYLYAYARYIHSLGGGGGGGGGVGEGWGGGFLSPSQCFEYL
jgi:hypothetical protein